MIRYPNIQPPFAATSDVATITSFSAECVGDDILPLASVFAIGTNWTANELKFIPLILREPFLLSQFFWFNGNVTNGNVDVGIYTEDGATRIISTGSTAASGASQIQSVDVTNTWLPANKRLWLAIGGDGTNRFVLSSLPAIALSYLGIKEQLSGWSSGLPSTITPATPTLIGLPLFGFTSGVV